jgi:hypothetical protein
MDHEAVGVIEGAVILFCSMPLPAVSSHDGTSANVDGCAPAWYPSVVTIERAVASSWSDWRELRDQLRQQPPTELPEPERSKLGLRTSFELWERGVRMMLMNLRRQFPRASDAEITERLRAWLSEHPGAENGDGSGRPAPERLRRILDGAP